MTMSNPWSVCASDFPYEGSPIDKMRFLLNYAVLAPSSHNTQPWLFRLHGGGVDIIADRTRALPVIDPHDRELVLSCGAAIGMLRIALRAFGHAGAVELMPNPNDPDLLATIGLGEPHRATRRDTDLRDAITRRRTTRVSFEDRAVRPSVISEMQAMAANDWITVKICMRRNERTELANLISEADRLQFADPSFRRELGAWMHSRHSATRDGMSLASMGVPDLLTPLGAAALRSFDIGGGRAAASQEIATHSPAIAIVATDRECPEDWLLAGQALANILTIATARGLSCGYLNQPVEVPGLRLRLAQTFLPDTYPQLILRLGYGPQIPPAVRRSVDEVVTGEVILAHV
jgi:nitroreductase